MARSIFFLTFFLSLAFVNAAQAADPAKHLVVLYNGDTKSYIEGCG